MATLLVAWLAEHAGDDSAAARASADRIRLVPGGVDPA